MMDKDPINLKKQEILKKQNNKNGNKFKSFIITILVLGISLLLLTIIHYLLITELWNTIEDRNERNEKAHEDKWSLIIESFQEGNTLKLQVTDKSRPQVVIAPGNFYVLTTVDKSTNKVYKVYVDEEFYYKTPPGDFFDVIMSKNEDLIKITETEIYYEIEEKNFN